MKRYGSLLGELHRRHGELEKAREAVARYFGRLGVPGVSPDDVYLGNGVSELIVMSLQGLLNPEKTAKGEEKEKTPLDPNVREARDLLQRALGLKVLIEDKNGRGRVIIEYSRLEDFDALLEALAGK